jgi:CRP/FNR family transcriptional regulator, cyclic AMP receptor protein
METVKFNAGDTILSEGADGNTAFLIVNGSVEVTVGKGSRVKSLGSLGAGEVFGEMSILEPGPRSATVVALTNTECVMTSYDDFMASISESPEQAIEFMKTLVRRLRQMNELMASMDPRKRRLRDVFRDWQKSIQQPDADLTDEELDRRQASLIYGWPMV